jgi:glycosyltransferase involved in cell wall biosynthesis
LEDGLSHFIINLIRYLPEESFDKFEYSVLINKNLQRKELTDLLKDPRLHVIEQTIAPIGPKRDWQMFWFLRKHKKDFDLIHITSNNYPFALNNGIATVHDITFKQFFDNPKFTFNLATTYMDKVINHALKNSRAIIAVSQATKDDLVKRYHLSADANEKINVVHLGWEHLVKDESVETEKCSEGLRFSKDYLLFVSTFRIHKNISNLLLAFQQAVASLPAGKKLIMIGNDEFLQKKDLDLVQEMNKEEDRVVFTGYLDKACMEQYFRHADAYIFPSLSEGFGLGVLEAFFYNIPLLCSNRASLPEIAGDAALYFDPYDVNDMARAIVQFYEDKNIGEELIAKGKERLKAFSWKRNAAETTAVYEKVLRKK